LATYISLLDWTEQGVKNVKDTVKRAETATQLAEKMGGHVTNIYWTQGAHDIVLISEFQDDEAVTAFLLATGAAGNIRTETMRAFSAQDINRIVQKIP
jgi:uncharacterized protein with GYD domain